MNLKHLLLAGGSLLGSSAAQAGGFQVTLAGQKNNGMGGVGTGLALDQAAMFYNPGALAMVRERGVQVGVNATLARQAFRGQYGGDERTLRNSVTTPLNLYAGFGPAEGKWKAGIGVYTPFGSKLQYADGWEGRFSLTDIELTSIFVQPTASYAITDQISVGAGFVVLASGGVNLKRDVPVSSQPDPNSPPQYGSIELDGKAETKYGYNVGVYFKPSSKLSLGITYRSQLIAQVKGGDVKFTNIPTSAAAGFNATRFNVELPLPATASIGIGIMPTEKLTIGLDANLAFWSEYRRLRFDFTDNDGAAAFVGGTDPARNTFSESKRSYTNSLTFRLGGQYQLTEALALRAGAIYDETPVPDNYVTPETPDNNRIGFSGGLTYKFGNFGVDLSTQFVSVMKRTQRQEDLVGAGTADRVAGTYKTNIVIPGIGFSYTF
jgi:long-chain fatty acid transport protein